MLFAVSSFLLQNASVEASAVDDFALTPAERRLFAALRARGVKFLIVGLGAAVLEGAPVATQDIDVWFETIDNEQIKLAAQDDELSRIDVVPTAHGLKRFAEEYDAGIEREIEGVILRILPLERVVASKRATARAKDAASLPALEATLRARAKTKV